MKYAFIRNNIAIEVLQTDPFMIFIPSYAAQFQEVNADCQAGMVLEDGVWVSAPVIIPIPQEITMRQARLVLLERGLLANVQPAIDSLPEPNKTKAQIEWEYSNALQRDNPFVTTLGTALGLSSDDIDNLFITASRL
jgi:hypothetical protein